ncbi:MAG TPA: NAD(P)H-dependent oxidoreductase [Polyangiales bacterium]|nr:NAD(P)H-dependent oxidoreductase [Polyangiales bacterium]
MSEPADVLLIAGSPGGSSRSAALLEALGKRLQAQGLSLRQYGLRDFSAEALVLGKFDAPEVVAFVAAVRSAKALVFATPVYKAVYSGGLKTIIDLIAPEGLEGKALLAVATAKLDAHGVTVDAAFQGLYDFFRGSRRLPTLFLLDPQLTLEGGSLELDDKAQRALEAAERALVAAVRG